ncbi:MAG: hypothetical protein F6K50_41365 [Moorea sp. SIO3I7]|nr:hypothetical protein [Moorena sp. SIO3I7]
MKGKILNYLVIIGVSIILLLGIVTTAFGQDNSNKTKNYDNDYILDFDKDCDKNKTGVVPISHQSSKNKDEWPQIGCIKTGINVEIKDSNDIVSYIKIKANYKPKYRINNDFLGCSNPSPGDICPTSQRRSSQN